MRLIQWLKAAVNGTSTRKFLSQVSGLAPAFNSLNSVDLNVPAAITATADGLTTGLVAAGTVWMNITSASADHIAAIPTPTAAGQKIRGFVGANGCELRTVASSNVKINDVDCDGSFEAAIPADTYIELDATTLTTYVLRTRTKLGAEGAAIIPDAA